MPNIALNSGCTLSGQFLGLISQYFQTKTVSLSLAFAVLCWVKSVALIQGGGFLAKTLYLAGDSQRVLQERLERCIEAGRLARDDKQLAKYVALLIEVIKASRPMMLLIVSNPYLAGACVLDRQLFALELGCQSLKVTSRFRAFGHLYSALRDRELMPALPLADQLLQKWGRMIFYPARPGVGSFGTTYQLSSHLTVAGMSSMRRGVANANGGFTVRRAVNARDLSAVFRMLSTTEGDFSGRR
ncbi:hypothetical protein B484DRAFT_337172, partial [Ochromonadaceae sp. CCMP2298]